MQLMCFEFCLREDLNKTAPRVMAGFRSGEVGTTTILKDKKSGWKP
jgi:hypothetical protein